MPAVTIRAMDGVATFDGTAIPFKSIKETEVSKSVEVTNNSTTGTGIQRKTLRFTKQIEITGVLEDAGAALVGKNCKFTFNSVDYPTTDVSFEETFETAENTSGSTAGSATSHHIYRADRKFSASFWKEDTVAKPARGSEASGTLLFDTGVSVAGSLTIDNIADDGEIKGDMKLTVSGYINGDPTQTKVGTEAGGDAATLTITYATGTSTNNAVTGTAYLFGKKVSTNIDGSVDVTYMFLFTGAVSDSIKADA